MYLAALPLTRASGQMARVGMRIGFGLHTCYAVLERIGLVIEVHDLLCDISRGIQERRILRNPEPKSWSYFPALRSSFGVASHTSWPLGGETRFNSNKATPAFFNEVT